jgi:hypothetical protein
MAVLISLCLLLTAYCLLCVWLKHPLIHLRDETIGLQRGSYGGPGKEENSQETKGLPQAKDRINRGHRRARTSHPRLAGSDDPLPSTHSHQVNLSGTL